MGYDSQRNCFSGPNKSMHLLTRKQVLAEDLEEHLDALVHNVPTSPLSISDLAQTSRSLDPPKAGSPMKDQIERENLQKRLFTNRKEIK